MKRFSSPLSITLLLAALAWPTFCRADLATEVRAVLQDKLLARGAVGIEITQLGQNAAADRILFTHIARDPLIPASNMKLVTTAAAIDVLGPDFRFRTLLLRKGDDLVLLGDGDPTFGDYELLKKSGWNVTTVFQNWAQALRKTGVTTIANVIVDDSIFDVVFAHPRWDANQLASRFSAEVAGMTLNLGAIDFSVRSSGSGPVSYTTNPQTRYVTIQNTCIGSSENAVVLDRQRGANNILLRGTCPSGEALVGVTIHDPALYAATVLAETFAANGIRVTGVVARDRTIRSQLSAPQSASSYTLLAVHETPLIRALERANKDSINPCAEALCKRIGYATTGTGSWSTGTAAAAEFLKRIGAQSDQYRLDDGCGLSRDNRLSASTLASVLRHQYHGKHRRLFMESLAVGGVDGTLDDRFKTADLRGRVFAKSGYIAGVSALSGYLRSKDGRVFAFSILMNNLPRGANARAKALQEKIVRAIARHAEKLP